jgi:hypothetical protein
LEPESTPLSDEAVRLQAIWAPSPQVDPALLDDAQISKLRHPLEWRALASIVVGVFVLGFALSIVRPFASDSLQWLPGPLVRLILEIFHPSRYVGLLALVVVGASIVDVWGQWLEVHETLADAVEITPSTMPQYAPVVEELRQRFGLPRTRVFVSRTSPMEPYAAGLWEPYVVVFNMGLLPMFTLDEFKFLLGHEFGHIKLGHTRTAVLLGGAHMKLSGVSGWVRRIKRQVTAQYDYAQELSCDRIGVLATRDVGPAVSTAIKWSAGMSRNSKIDLTTLATQAEELRRGPAATAALVSRLNRGRPRLIERLLALTSWAGLPKPKPPAPATTPAPAPPAEGAAATAPTVTTATTVATATTATTAITETTAASVTTSPPTSQQAASAAPS